ncbi:Glutamate receptor 2.7 [Sesamum angolense]|uniref:Glutamate receptor 2.7 n=1 Tax=Sesamum angolense TaxID=2727404 RepID=A0AAE2C0G1_9LAMI|nr:Glutamate receptor 2.7 [Sesamum angolense]
MLHEIPQKFDMVVGDTTIWAPRIVYVDFSLPYSESGVILVVKNKKPFDMWIFVKPLRWDLWLAIIVACFFMGIVLHILERRVTSKDTDPLSANKERPRMVYWSPVAVLAFPESFSCGSPLVSHFSKAIMDVTQGPNMTAIEQENFGPGYSSQDPLSSTISQQTSSLTLYDFAGLFLIIGSVTIFALFCSETAIGRKDKLDDEEIREPVQDNVSNPREDTNEHVVGEVELHEIGPSNAQNLGMRTESNEERNS